ncbi:MAG TPA: DUF692 domain-containing protein [Polyangiaceae bacterium]
MRGLVADPRLAGVGLGLRWEFLDEVLAGPEPGVPFFEVSPENYMRRGGYYRAALETLLERCPIITHGLTLSLGAEEPPDSGYLEMLRVETQWLHSPWHSDHLCFTAAGGRVLHELLPLKFSRENVLRIADRVRAAEDFLGLPMAVENITFYAHPGRREMTEAEFITAIAERSGCALLLDVNNVYVNAQNHGFDAREMLEQLPLERVVQVHVAGHTRSPEGFIIDTHGAAVPDAVLELLRFTLERTGPLPVVLERDHDIPALAELLKEVAKLESAYTESVARWQERRAQSA